MLVDTGCNTGVSRIFKLMLDKCISSIYSQIVIFFFPFYLDFCKCHYRRNGIWFLQSSFFSDISFNVGVPRLCIIDCTKGKNLLSKNGLKCHNFSATS